MVQWHRFVEPVFDGSDAGATRSSVTLQDGSVIVHCGDADSLVGVSGDADCVKIRMNGETHQYDRAVVRRVIVTGVRGNHDIELTDRDFDMLVVAHGARSDDGPRGAPGGGDLHAARAQRHRRAADDFGMV